MTGKEIVNLIDRLEDKGLKPEEIIEIIRYVELTDPQERRKEKDHPL